MTATVEVAIVGAGVTGLSIAFQLRERGVGPVVVLERSGIGAGASGVQPGGVRRQWGTREHCLLAQESYAFWQELDARLDTRTHALLEPCGYLFAARSEEALATLRTNVELQNGLGVPSEIVSPAALEELVPGLDASSLLGGAWCGTDGYFDRPQTVVEAFGEAALRRGAELTLAQVDELVPDGDGWLVRLANGDRIRATHVVLAAGYETPALTQPLGLELPIEREPRYVFLSAPIQERLLEPLVVASEIGFAAKHLANGRVLAGDLGATGDPALRRDTWRQTVRRGIEELTPTLSFVSFDLLVDGIYDTTPDHEAILGPVDGLAGLWLAAGFSGHGFMMAPAVGRALADWICDVDPGEGAAALRSSRFRNGSELRFETQVV
ncbi:MAG TPA: FAD-binding oxidoreductase [Gaiellaceae bacterium]